jgi:hypothetical protein
LIDAPCPLFASHGASIIRRRPLDGRIGRAITTVLLLAEPGLRRAQAAAATVGAPRAGAASEPRPGGFFQLLGVVRTCLLI